VLAAGLAVLVRGLAYRNPYELVLAGMGLSVWLWLFFTGWTCSRRLARLAPGWQAPLPLAAGAGGEAHIITGLDAALPYFFRLHFVVRGEFSPARGKRFLVSAEVSGGEGAAALNLVFPLSGVFQGRGLCRLRDVFGFFSFPCGTVLHRSLNVRPAPFHRRPSLRIDPFSGAEDKQSRSQTDEERYYMREYAPGDRFRDINWKTSERLSTLITRISPHTQEKTRLVRVALRNHGPAPAPLSSLWLLDRTKARLMVFLRTLREEHANFIFHITTARDERFVESEEDMEAFFDDLAGMSFAPGASAAPPGELYIFSTACDTGLAAFLASRDAPSYLYITMPGRFRPRAGRDEIAALRVSGILQEGFIPLWGFSGGRKAAGITSVPRPGRGGLEITYAEIRP
jgi:hypothetical protein